MSSWITNSAKFGRNVNDIATFGLTKNNENIPGPFGFSDQMLLSAQHRTSPLTPREPPSVPSLDQATLGSQQQQDLMRRRRGVVGNIFAGGNTSAPAPATAGKTLLGT